MNFITSTTLLLPFIGFLLSFFFGKILGNIGASFITTVFMYGSTMASIYLFICVLMYRTTYTFDLCDWINSDIINIKWSFQYDALTSTMLLVVNIVSFCTHLYSIEYMEGDPYKVRFMSYLSLFTFFMVILITSSNLFQLFVGWEGVGICSYLLINFWFHRLQANKAAIMAIMTNKIGDIALLISFCMVLYLFKSLDYGILFSVCTDYLYENTEYILTNLNYGEYNMLENVISYEPDYNKKYIESICLLFIIGAIGKSAQLGMHIWLPTAMEGPTPVSSLIHAATMVTAGIFLIIRCSFIFEVVQNVLLMVVLVGSLTSFFASTVACFQDDIKKVIAYSTCSQLGYMFTACGYSAYSNSIFHLFNHAFFKALLFLTAGYIIHAISNEQDMRSLSQGTSYLPFAYVTLSIGTFALTGFPFLSGFYSKEKILELFYSKIAYSLTASIDHLHLMYACNFISTIAVIFTIIYSAKMASILTSGTPEGPKVIQYSIVAPHSNIKRNDGNGAHIFGDKIKLKKYVLQIHHGDHLLIIPLFILSMLSIFSGNLFADIMVGVSNNFWNDALYVGPKETNIYIQQNVEWLLLNNSEYNKYIKGISLICGLYYSFIFMLIYSLWICFYKQILTPISEQDECSYYKEYLLNNRAHDYTITAWVLHIKRIMIEKYIFIDKIWLEPLMSIFFKCSLYCYYTIDRGMIELIGPMGIVKFINSSVYKYKKYQSSGKTTIYINIVILCVMSLFITINFFI